MPPLRFGVTLAGLVLVVAAVSCGRISSEPAQVDRSSPASSAKTSSQAPPSEVGWFEVGRGDLARVEVEQVLYRRSGDEQFYVRLRVENLTDREVGADLRDPDLAPYPNQWGGLAQPRREVINERRLDLDPRRSAIASDAVAGLRASALAQIPGGQWLEFYRPFNAGSVSAIVALDAGETPFVFVSFDGVVPIAVSTVAELVATGASLILPVPVVWRQVPEDAWVIPH